MSPTPLCSFFTLDQTRTLLLVSPFVVQCVSNKVYLIPYWCPCVIHANLWHHFLAEAAQHSAEDTNHPNKTETEAGCEVKAKLEILFSWRWENIEHVFMLNETKSNRRWDIHEAGERGSNGRSKGREWQREMGIRKRAEAGHQCLLPCKRRRGDGVQIKYPDLSQSEWVQKPSRRWEGVTGIVGSWRENVLLQGLNRRFDNMQPALGPTIYESWGCPWSSELLVFPVNYSCHSCLIKTWDWSGPKFVHLKSQ